MSDDDLTRLTVDLTESAATALDFAAVLTGDSRTDTAGRALLVYRRIVTAAAAGGGRVSFDLTKGGGVKALLLLLVLLLRRPHRPDPDPRTQRETARGAGFDTYTPQTEDRLWNDWLRHHGGGP